MRFRLRTLLIFLALGPPLLAGAWFAARWLVQGDNLLFCVLVLLGVAAYAALAVLAANMKRLIRLAFAIAATRRRRAN